MHFALTEEQIELASTVRALVARRAGTVDVRAAIVTEAGYDTELWSTLCEQIGVAALAIPEEYGGAGFSSFETHVVLEELGATLTPTPLLGSGVIATQALLRSGNAAACERILPDLASGESTAALAWASADGELRPDGAAVTATGSADAWTLSGAAGLVLEGAAADVLLVIADTGAGIGLFEVAPDAAGVTREVTPALDPTLRFATIRFENAAATPISTDYAGALAALYAIGATAVTALQTGGARRALELTVAYLKEREQFGRPLASFQALKHRAADLVVDTETSVSMSWSAAWAIAQADLSDWAPTEAAEAVRQAGLAKAWCSDAFSHVTSEMIQLHGGIAITWEHDAHLYFKRAHACAQLFGRAAEHRRSIKVQL
ncbi:acyl-CoA dehydrogenase family protein [Nocardioides sp.]|uniref:acyl-CoA dehydrogenase family protein n=1 Tax=Nocardioides sp. TaxID=35761 RepID=UPI00260F60D0|nr:acyl-CoA dehydrogenase family protein [Nocardioides sp.]